MILEDWHTHNQLCRHAKGKVGEYIEEAINKGVKTIGISDHFPYEIYENLQDIPYEEYAMTLEELDNYLIYLSSLRKEYGSKINIRFAFEVEYLQNQISLFNRYFGNIKNNLDYILGSIHILSYKGELWPIDDSRYLEQFSKYKSIDTVYEQYYEAQLKMIKDKEFDFDIVGHFDLLKKLKKYPENPEIILEKAFKVLEAVKTRGLVVEINTSGYRKEVNEQYPSIEIIQKLFELEIPILLGSDAHKPSEVAYDFKKMIKTLRNIGFSKLAHFEKRKISYINL